MGNWGGGLSSWEEGTAWAKSGRPPPDWKAGMGGDGNGNGFRPLPQPHWSPLPQMWTSVPTAPRPVPTAAVRTQKAASSVSAQQASNPTLLAPSARVRPGREGGLRMGERGVGPPLQGHLLPCTPDVDECENHLACPGQECVNSPGSFQCRACPAGYHLHRGRCSGETGPGCDLRPIS